VHQGERRGGADDGVGELVDPVGDAGVPAVGVSVRLDRCAQLHVLMQEAAESILS